MSVALNVSSAVANQMQQLTFGWTDYLLFSGLLGISLLIGIYFGFFSKQDSAKEYLFGGKTMAYIPVAISILASLLSGITFLGIPTETYFFGGHYFVSAIPSILNCIITGYLFIPIFFKLQVSSTYEYLELRFSKAIRSLTSSLYIISLMLYIPIVIYVPSLAFAQVTGYSIHLISPIFSLVCITYTTMGGVKAVVWTDTIQLFFTIGGLYTILTIGIHSIGGISEVWRISKEGSRLDIFNMDPNPLERNTFWSVSIGMFFSTLSRFAIGQKFVQRFLSIESEVNIKKSLFVLGFGWITLQFSCIITGLVIYAKYHDCDPLTAKFISRSDQILPFYVMDVVGHIHGLPGIFLAGLVSSALSTMSASLNSLSGIIYEDFVDSWIPESPKKDAKAANIMKIISVIIGLLAIALIFVIEHLGTIFEMANSLSSIVDGPLLGVFLLGMMFPWVGKKGAIYGAGASLAVMSWLVGGTQWNIYKKRVQPTFLPISVENCSYPSNETLLHVVKTPINPEDQPIALFRISFMYLIMIGSFLTIIIGLITSFIVGESDLSKVDPLHIAPFCRRFLPKKIYAEVPLKEVEEKKICKQLITCI